MPTAALVAAACGSGSDDSGADAQSESTEIRSTPETTTTTPAPATPSPTTSTTSTTTSTTSTTSTTVATSTTTVASSRDPEQIVADWISLGATAEEVECLSRALNTQGWDTLDNAGMFLPIAQSCDIEDFERLAIFGVVTKLYGEPINTLDVGDCVNGTGFDDPPPLSNPGELTYADCAEPHDLEVFHLEVMDQSPNTPYPGEDAVRMLADEVCLENFEAYVGVDYDESPLGYFYNGPTEADWQAGTSNRAIFCFLYDPTLESLPPLDPQT